jgi:hypothetical protein
MWEGCIFFDMEEAFDCIDRSILLANLKFCRITERAYSLISSYLENRYQRVSVSNDSSNENTFSI